MRTRSAILPLALAVAFALFTPSFWMIDVFQSQTPAAMIVSSTQASHSDTTSDATPWSVADEGNDDLDPFTPIVPPHTPISSPIASLEIAILPPPLHPAQAEFDHGGSLPPSLSQEVPTTPPLHQA